MSWLIPLDVARDPEPSTLVIFLIIGLILVAATVAAIVAYNRRK